MELLKRKRTTARQLFSRACTKIDEVLAESNPTNGLLSERLRAMEEKAATLKEVDHQLIEAMEEEVIAGTMKEDDFTKEIDDADEYQDKMVLYRAKIIDILNKLVPQNSVKDEPIGTTQKRNFKLPYLEQKQFDGDLKNWLGFWGQFKKIDEDPEIPDEDKFQYLLQGTVVGSPARQVIESFPPSGTNYRKALNHLKERFAKEEFLIEAYFRELLTLVIRQATKKSDISISSLYDRISSHLRALESMNVTNEKYAAMLFPMVESCLPMDVLKAWGRFRLAPHQDDAGSTKTPDKLLDALMKFIKAEVENEERMRLAANGFGLEQVVGSCNLASKNVSLLSAATLLITDADTEKKIDLNKKVTVESEKIVQRTPSPDQVKSAENIETKGDGLVFVETIFGWTVMGRYPQQLSPICIGNLNLELRERWELEDVENPEAPTNKLDNDRIENFEGTITCDEDVTRKKQKGKPASTQSTDQINITAAFEITGVDLAGRLYRKDTWKIRWKLNPTTAAWWGGWWERIVRVVKELIRENLPREINQEEGHRMIHPATKTRSGRVVHPHKQYRD
ncbi:unnamed protein product [Nesidiocoris tenuis]|uniref:Uncharacterized protein n=1 Tax=Nesidiocoris tenuis TaxID=355587 RepID=A0A6H5GDY6_9HEMI|nr:unnamed protein product [Nesidiocoris tenuis]